MSETKDSESPNGSSSTDALRQELVAADPRWEVHFNGLGEAVARHYAEVRASLAVHVRDWDDYIEDLAHLDALRNLALGFDPGESVTHPSTSLASAASSNPLPSSGRSASEGEADAPR